MKFEVTDRKEEKTGLIFKKSIFLARTRIHFETNEFDALKAMGQSKEWKEYPLAELRFTKKITTEVTVGTLYSWAKKKGFYERGIRAANPEEREYLISQMQELAQKAKDVINVRLSAQAQTDEDVSIEL